MATDAYIKFGEGSGTSPYNTPLPDIEGDSTDEKHYWWSELRGYDFALEAGERDSSADGDKMGTRSPQPASEEGPSTLNRQIADEIRSRVADSPFLEPIV